MRSTVPLVLGLLSCAAMTGCQPFYAATGVVAGVDVVALTTLGRSVPDAVVSLIRNRDCSVVRLEQAHSYCVPVEAAPEPPAFCTASLGRPDCWAFPARLADQQAGLADAPGPTAEQIAHRAHHWPDAWSDMTDGDTRRTQP